MFRRAKWPALFFRVAMFAIGLMSPPALAMRAASPIGSEAIVQTKLLSADQLSSQPGYVARNGQAGSVSRVAMHLDFRNLLTSGGVPASMAGPPRNDYLPGGTHA